MKMKITIFYSITGISIMLEKRYGIIEKEYTFHYNHCTNDLYIKRKTKYDFERKLDTHMHLFYWDS